MDFELTVEQKMLKTNARDFLKKELAHWLTDMSVNMRFCPGMSWWTCSK